MTTPTHPTVDDARPAGQIARVIRVTISALGAHTVVHRIAKDEVTLGRGNTNDVPLQGIGISRQHCRAFLRDGTIYVEDMGSTNGTVIRGTPIEGPMRVPPGTPVDVGECRVLFQYDPDDEPQEPMERTMSIPAAPAPPKPPPSSGAVSRVVDQVRAERQQKRSTLSRSRVAPQPVDRRETVRAIRTALDHLILDEMASQFERELRASAPPSDAALALLKRLLTAEVQAMDEDDR